MSLPFYDLKQLLTNEFLCNCTALYLSVNVFSTKALIISAFVLNTLVSPIIGDTIFTSPPGDGTAILHAHPSHAKV